MASLGLYYCSNPSWHTFNQFLTHLWLYLSPFLYNSLPHLPNSLGWCFILRKLFFEVLPEVFNGVKVWRLCRPVQKSDIVVFHPLLGLLWGVFGVIVWLIISMYSRNLWFIYAGEWVFLQNVNKPVSIDHFLNFIMILRGILILTGSYYVILQNLTFSYFCLCELECI